MKCKKCGHEWINKVENPIQCPKCKNTDYNNEKVYEVKRRRKEDDTPARQTEQDKPKNEITFE